MAYVSTTFLFSVLVLTPHSPNVCIDMSYDVFHNHYLWITYIYMHGGWCILTVGTERARTRTSPR